MSTLAVKAEFGDSQVGVKCSPYCNEPETPQPLDVQRRVEPMRHELRERKIDCLPAWDSCEMGPIGLPRADIVRRA